MTRRSVTTFMRARLKRHPRIVWLVKQLRTARAMAETPTRSAAGFLFSGNQQMLDGTFEVEETRWLGDAFREADVFVDVGANIGYYTCLARGAGLQVVAVEPLSRNTMVLFKNLEANGWDDVEVFPLGLGQTSRVVELYGDSTGASLVRGWAGASDHSREHIAVSTLDIIVKDRFAGKRVVVKMDIEGAELDALRGATSLLSSHPAPVWMIEVMFREHHPLGANPHFRSTFELMWSYGYSASAADASCQTVEREDLDRWTASGSLDFGGHNYIFRKAG